MAMAADGLVSSLPAPLALMGSQLILGPQTIAKVAGIASDVFSGIGNILGGGGYTPEELAKNAAIQTALITAGEDPRNAIAKPAASPFKSVVTF
jgi:hypothetical protein